MEENEVKIDFNGGDDIKKCNECEHQDVCDGYRALTISEYGFDIHENFDFENQQCNHFKIKSCKVCDCKWCSIKSCEKCNQGNHNYCMKCKYGSSTVENISYKHFVWQYNYCPECGRILKEL